MLVLYLVWGSGCGGDEFERGAPAPISKTCPHRLVLALLLLGTGKNFYKFFCKFGWMLELVRSLGPLYKWAASLGAQRPLSISIMPYLPSLQYNNTRKVTFPAIFLKKTVIIVHT